MIYAYTHGIDIYSSMASKVFTTVVKDFASRLERQHASEADLKHYSSPLYKTYAEGGFVYLENDKWTYKEVTIADAYDGSIFRKFMKTLLLGEHHAAWTVKVA